MASTHNTGLEIQDEGNYTDRRKKKDLLDMRETVTEWQRELFTQVRFGELDLNTAVTIWGERVREYLERVEPILLTGDGPTFTQDEEFDYKLDGAREVYTSVELGVVEVPPPEEYGQLARQAQESEHIKILEDSHPQPKERVIKGIKEVIERETVAAEWEVSVYDGRLPPSDRVREQAIQNEVPLNRVTLRNAVRVADEWLQNHGIGIETDSGRDLFKISVRNDPEDYDEPWKEGTPKPK